MNWKKAIEYDNFYKNCHICFTIFPYQIGCGCSIGFFENIRIRLYLLIFKLAIDINFK